MKPLPSRRGQRGLSLVELMVGITVGLFIVGAATIVVTTQLGDNRRLLLETQLQQDLRASADIIAREIRRAGSRPASGLNIWYPGKTSPVTANSFGSFSVSEDGDSIDFSYRRGSGAEGPYGFRLTDNGIIESTLGTAGSQELTDPRVMDVTAFQIQAQEVPSNPLPCPRLCADGSTDCWPRLIARDVLVNISATSRNDAQVRRSVSLRVRVRNDGIQFNNGTSICP